jgi:hypothetical protein
MSIDTLECPECNAEFLFDEEACPQCGLAVCDWSAMGFPALDEYLDLVDVDEEVEDELFQ